MEMMRKGTVRMDLNGMIRVLKQGRALFIIGLALQIYITNKTFIYFYSHAQA
jgi:hypothetical protein